jgi:uncharacterized protein (DUF1015 family)
MAILHPFRALRPIADHVAEVACVPYDVIDTNEARTLARGKPLSFLHVIRPEIDLPEGTDEHAEEVYERGAENLRKYRASNVSLEDESPGIYLYRLVMEGRSQTGIFGCVSVADYDNDVILKHEKTRPDKEDDRTRHIVTQRAHAEPVMLTFRGTSAIRDAMEEVAAGEPLYDFTADDGIIHTIWKADNPTGFVAAFEGIEHLYVADGHHRCKAASRAAAEVGSGSDEEASFFPAVLFPMAEMEIMAYNRVVKQLPGKPDDFLEELRKRFDVESVTDSRPSRRGEVCMYLPGSWHRFSLPDASSDDVASQLDVARLSEHVLEPLLGIRDPRTDKNIAFVGGIRGTGELERVVDSGEAAVAFSMYPTSIQELVDVSDAGQLMPPKSTWFEPKLRSGLLVHLFE